MTAQEPYLPPAAPLRETLPPAGSFVGGFALGVLLFAATTALWFAVFFGWEVFGNPGVDGSVADRAALFGFLLIPTPCVLLMLRGFMRRRVRSATGTLVAVLLPVLALAIWLALLAFL